MGAGEINLFVGWNSELATAVMTFNDSWSIRIGAFKNLLQVFYVLW